MRKKIFKTVLIFLMFFIVFSCYNSVRATGNLKEIMEKGQSFVDEGEKQYKESNIDGQEVVKPIITIGNILVTIGIAVLLGATAYMGIKYLTSGPDARAKLKQQLIGLLVSGIVIFGAYSIWKIVITIGQTLS